jgi:hypothetical protein
LIAARINPGWRMKFLIGCRAEPVVIVPSSGAHRASRYDQAQTTAVTQIFVGLQVVAAPIANVCWRLCGRCTPQTSIQTLELEICKKPSLRRGQIKEMRETVKLSVEAKVAAAVAAGFVALTVGAIAQTNSNQTGAAQGYSPAGDAGTRTELSQQGHIKPEA